MSTGALLLAGLGSVPASAEPEGRTGGALRAYALGGPNGEPSVPPGQRSAAAARSAEQAADRPQRRTVTLDDLSLDAPPSPAQGVARVAVTQDLGAGVVEARATYRAAPTAAANSVLVVYLGEWSGNRCERRLALAGAVVGNDRAGLFLTGEGGTYTDAGPIGFTVTRSSSQVTFRTASDARIRAADWDCAYFDVFQVAPSNTSPVVYQQSYAEDLADQYAPSLELDLDAAAHGNYRGKWATVRLDVRNASRSPATGVKVTAKGAGIEFKPRSRTLGTIGARSSEAGLTFKVRLAGKKPKKKQRRATFVATSGGRTFTQPFIVAEKPRPKKVKSLAGRYYWGFLPAAVDTGWDNRALWFVDRRWVYVGFAKGGKKPRCNARVKGCKRYTYNSRTGRVKIGKQRAKVTTEGFRIKAVKGDPKVTFQPTTLAKKGQRLRAELMRHDFEGFCGIWCNTWTEWFSLDTKGRFVLSRMTISSLGPPGVGSIFGSVPPDQRGTYKVGANGRVVLTFANGAKKAYTLAFQHDVRGKPSPQGLGLLLGDRNFYR